MSRWPLVPTLKSFSTCKGVVVPEKFRSNVFWVFVGPSTVRLLTVMEPGKLSGVDGLMATAFQTEFVIITACELLGRTFSDQFVDWSQLPLAGLIHEFTCAEAGAPVRAIARVKKQSCRFISVMCVEIRILIRSSVMGRTILEQGGGWR